MSGIETFREQYPQYQHVADEDIAEAVFKKDYSTADRNEFMSAFLGSPTLEPEPTAVDVPNEAAIDPVPESVLPAEEAPAEDGLSFTRSGQQYDVNTEGYPNEEAAMDSFLEGDNPPTKISESETFDEDTTVQATPDESAGSYELDAIANQPEQAKTSFDLPEVGAKATAPGESILNADGSQSSEVTKTFGIEIEGVEKQVLLPTVIPNADGVLEQVSDEEALSLYKQGKNEPVGIFDTEEEASKFAGERSEAGGRFSDKPSADTQFEDSFAPPKEKAFAWLGGQLAKEGQDETRIKDDVTAAEYTKGRFSAFAGRQNLWVGGAIETYEDLDKGTLASLGPAGKALVGMRRTIETSDIIRDLKDRAERLMGRGEATKPVGSEGVTGALGMLATDVIDGAANMLPAILVTKGAGAAGATPKAAGNLGLAEMGLQVWGETYGTAKDEGDEPAEAAYKASRQTLWEVGPEKLFGYFDKLGGKGVKDWFMQTLREGASEILTSVLEQGDEHLIEGDPWQGWVTASKRALYDGLVGIGMGGVLSANMLVGKKGQDETAPADPDVAIGEYKSQFDAELDEWISGVDEKTEPTGMDRAIEEALDRARSNIETEESQATRWTGNLLDQIERDVQDHAKLIEIFQRERRREKHEKAATEKHYVSIAHKLAAIRKISEEFKAPGFDEAIDHLEAQVRQPLLGVGSDEPELLEDRVMTEAEVREFIAPKTHDEMMGSPAYKKYFDSTDLGELSQDQSVREHEARESFVRKAQNQMKWKPIVEEAQRKQDAAEEAEPSVGIDAAVEEREAFEETKAESESLLPENFDPLYMVWSNADGFEQEWTIEEAANAVEKFDKQDKDEIKITVNLGNDQTQKVTFTREERDQLSEEIDVYLQEYEEGETLDSPRSEEREERPLKMDKVPVVEVDPSDVTINAPLMQFKSGTDAQGRSERLKGVKKWNPANAGTVTLWQDIEGKLVLADGHQRWNLLMEMRDQGLELDTKLDARIYREEDGYTARDVRVIASEMNLAQGSGTAIDAAKVLRGLSEEAVAEAFETLPPNSALIRDAKGLAKLGEEAFAVAVSETIEPRFGAMVGEAFEESEQLAAMQILIRSTPSSFAEAASMIADIQAGGFVKSEQGGLFGEVEMESLIKERAQILSSAESALKKNVQVFKALTQNEAKITKEGENKLDTKTNEAIVKSAQSVMDSALRTINTNPELNDALNKTAKQLRAGEITRVAAAKQFVEAATAYTESRSRKLADESRSEGSRDKEKEKTKKPTKKTAKTPAQVTITEEVKIEETGETATISENGAQALLKLDKRISVLEQLRDCVLA